MRDTKTLREILEAEAFGPSEATRMLVGLEAEFVILSEEDGVFRPPVRTDPDGKGHPLLRALGRRLNSPITATKGGSPYLRYPDAGGFTLEPGGQLEYSSAPGDNPRALLDEMYRASDLIREESLRLGFTPSTRGIQALPGDGLPPLILDADRYVRMAGYLADIGPWGARMMRQTASLQVNLSWGPSPAVEWAAACRVAPILTAIFANSPAYMGRATGHRSFRSSQWRRLDPSRTGVPWRRSDPVGAYLDFALAAPAFLLGDRGFPARPFGEWWGVGGASTDDFRIHLSTLFPEVRPRGHMEFWGLDALPEAFWPAALAVCVGVVRDGALRETMETMIPDPCPELLTRAAQDGLSDAGIMRVARTLVAEVIPAAGRLGLLEDPRVEASLADLRDRVTGRGRDPGSFPEPGDGAAIPMDSPAAPPPGRRTAPES